MSKLQTRTRKPGESIAAFGDDLLLMAQKAYANLYSDAQEMLALQQFYQALPLEMRCGIMDKDCTSISEAVNVVERYEDLINENTDRKRAVTRAADRQYSDDSNQSAEGTDTENLNGNFPHNGRQGSKKYFKRKNQSTASQNQRSGMHNDNALSNIEQMSIAQTLREVVERLSKLERGRERPRGNRQNMQRANQTCFVCNSPDHFFRQCPRYRSAQTGTVPSAENMQLGNGNQSLL